MKLLPRGARIDLTLTTIRSRNQGIERPAPINQLLSPSIFRAGFSRAEACAILLAGVGLAFGQFPLRTGESLFRPCRGDWPANGWRGRGLWPSFRWAHWRETWTSRRPNDASTRRQRKRKK